MAYRRNLNRQGKARRGKRPAKIDGLSIAEFMLAKAATVTVRTDSDDLEGTRDK